MGQNVTIYPPKIAHLHTNISIHGRFWQCKRSTFLLMIDPRTAYAVLDMDVVPSICQE